VVSVRAAMDLVLEPNLFRDSFRVIKRGQLLPPTELAAQWLALGYEPSALVDAPGDANDDPNEKGWMIEIEMTKPEEAGGLGQLRAAGAVLAGRVAKRLRAAASAGLYASSNSRPWPPPPPASARRAARYVILGRHALWSVGQTNLLYRPRSCKTSVIRES